jgi:hypothetical protein
MTGHLDEVLEQFRSDSGSAPRPEEVLNVAASLDRQGRKDLALEIEEFEYERELAVASPPASAWFGLAEVRIAQKRNDDALSLIRGVTLTVGAPFENLPEAVRVLQSAGLNEQAARYAAEWKTAVPWSAEAQLAFARLESDTGVLNEIRSLADAPYSVRVRAARLLRGLDSPAAGKDELTLLTQKHITAADASQPFYVQARLDAAEQSTVAAEKLRLYSEAIALDPGLREPRLNLAHLALSNRQDAFGLAVLFSYLNGPVAQYLARGLQPPIEDTENDHQKLAAVEQLAADALVREHRYGEAAQLYGQALNTAQDQAKRAQLANLRNAAQQRQQLEAANAARQPLVGDGITQNRIVKPKLKTLPSDWVASADSEPGEDH